MRQKKSIKKAMWYRSVGMIAGKGLQRLHFQQRWKWWESAGWCCGPGKRPREGYGSKDKRGERKDPRCSRQLEHRSILPHLAGHVGVPGPWKDDQDSVLCNSEANERVSVSDWKNSLLFIPPCVHIPCNVTLQLPSRRDKAYPWLLVRMMCDLIFACMQK